MKKKIFFCIILILIGIMTIITNIYIGKYDWHLRSCFIWLASFMIPLGILLLGTFSLNGIKKESMRIPLKIIWIIINAVVAFIELILLVWIIKETPIKEIDGVKYCSVEYYTNRLRKEVYYYKEYNVFAYHKTKEYITEFYEHNDYEHPLYREYHKENLKDEVLYDYDENGKIIEEQQ